jgi:hypothetical protein
MSSSQLLYNIIKIKPFNNKYYTKKSRKKANSWQNHASILTKLNINRGLIAPKLAGSYGN